MLAVAAAGFAQLAGTAPAAAAPSTNAARILYYDASRAAEFVNVVHQGANNWNSRVTNVQLRPVTAGVRANITVIADNGWPRAITTSLGNGRWYMGRVAVNDGHSPPRIAAHEFGHLLGLPDRRTGLCTDLMSGASAGTSCRNAFPSATEASRVNANFASATTSAALAAAQVHEWECFASPTAIVPAAAVPAHR
jgi:snapalysin